MMKKSIIDGLVSIVTPMYNAENFIEETIQSVCKQTYAKWELIIVDDCSTDRSVEIARKYSEMDQRIRIICNASNVGVAATRNRAIDDAKGQYIAFLDSDDIWLKDKLEKQLETMKKTGSPFCYGMCGVIDSTGKNLNKDRVVPKEIDYKELLKGNVIPCLTVLIDRKRIDIIEMPNIPHEDYACWLTIFDKYGIVAHGIQTVIAQYRIVEKSISNNKIKAAGWTWNIYRNYLKLPICKSVWCFICYIIKAIAKHY